MMVSKILRRPIMANQSSAEQLAEKRRIWEQLIQQWKDSGLSQTEFCRLHNLKTHQLTYWKKRFHRTQAPASLVSLSGMVETPRLQAKKRL
jgi:hypothetical protein